MDLGNLVANSVYLYLAIVLPTNLSLREYKYFKWFPHWSGIFRMMAVALAVQLGIAITCFVERKKLTEVEKGVMAQGMTSIICVYQGFLFSQFEETFY